jgi:hypothetical protein
MSNGGRAKQSRGLLDAAYATLRKGGKPLRAREIMEVITREKLWSTQGKTPMLTLQARLSMDVRTKLHESRFQRVEPGLFALREWGLREYHVPLPWPRGLKPIRRSPSAK